MKLIFISILGLFLVISCTSSETPQEEKDNGSMVEVPVVEDSIEENSVTSKLANQWVLVNRTNTKKDKEVEFSNDNSFIDRKSTRLNSSHVRISYAVFCLKKKKKKNKTKIIK